MNFIAFIVSLSSNSLFPSPPAHNLNPDRNLFGITKRLRLGSRLRAGLNNGLDRQRRRARKCLSRVSSRTNSLRPASGSRPSAFALFRLAPNRSLDRASPRFFTGKAGRTMPGDVRRRVHVQFTKHSRERCAPRQPCLRRWHEGCPGPGPLHRRKAWPSSPGRTTGSARPRNRRPWIV